MLSPAKPNELFKPVPHFNKHKRLFLLLTPIEERAHGNKVSNRKKLQEMLKRKNGKK